MATRREAATQSRRRTISDAALFLFLENGVATTRVEDILARAEASIGSFYHHYGNKVNLAVTLYIDSLENLYQALLYKLLQRKAAESGVRGLVRDYISWAQEYPIQMQYLLHCREPDVIRASAGREQSLTQNFFQGVATWLRPHAEAGAIQSLDIELYHALIIGPSELLIREATERFEVYRGEEIQAYKNFLANARELLESTAWQSIK